MSCYRMTSWQNTKLKFNPPSRCPSTLPRQTSPAGSRRGSSRPCSRPWSWRSSLIRSRNTLQRGKNSCHWGRPIPKSMSRRIWIPSPEPANGSVTRKHWPCRLPWRKNALTPCTKTPPAGTGLKMVCWMPSMRSYPTHSPPDSRKSANLLPPRWLPRIPCIGCCKARWAPERPSLPYAPCCR